MAQIVVLSDGGELVTPDGANVPRNAFQPPIRHVSATRTALNATANAPFKTWVTNMGQLNS